MVVKRVRVLRSELPSLIKINISGASNDSIGTATITNATPAVVTRAAHGLSTGNIVYFTTTGALPTGLTANTRYWVNVLTSSTFRLSTSLANALAGTSIATSSAGSGTHTVYSGDTVTYTFSKPHRAEVGYIVNISSAVPAEFSQTNAKVIAVPNDLSFTISKTVTSAYISGGYIEVPVNPSIDTYLIKYRIVNNQNQYSQWSPLFPVKNTYQEDSSFNYLDGGEE